MSPPFTLPLAASGVADCDGYTRFKDVFIPLRDGVKICANVFLPSSSLKNGVKAPVLATVGPYGKDVPSTVFGLPKTPIYANMYKAIEPKSEDSVFEVVDPIVWVGRH